MGFKYAGTGNREAFRLILSYCNFFKKLKVMQSNKDSIGIIYTNANKNVIDRNTVETCLCVSAFAMSMVMAGTGDAECFRVLRVLRKRFEVEMHYGYNMAVNMSLGFLFLGSGAFTFARSDLAIAALICALYPQFPSNPSDNRYHLQALRHFYVLAIESRLLQARDIDSGEFLNIAMDVEVADDSEAGDMIVDERPTKTVRITTPDIVNGKVLAINVKSDLYHDVHIKLTQDSTEPALSKGIDKRQKIFEQFDFQKIVHVKKKTAEGQAQGSQKQPEFRVAEKVTSELVEGAAEVREKAEGVKDPTLKAVIKNFTDIGVSALAEIEDVLLAQG